MGRRGTVSSRTTRYRVGPQRHGAFGEVAAGGREAGGGDGPDVTLGLQEPGDDLGFAGADEGGGFLEADGGAEPGGQDVVVAVPPAGCAGLAGQGEERVDLAAVGDAVGHQQALDGQGLEAALGAFHPADGPFGGADGIPGLLVAHPGFLAQGLELAGQDHAQHGGAAAVGAGHRFLPLSLFQASGCHRFRSRAICGFASCRQVSVPVLPFPHRPAPGTGHSKHTIVPAERGGAGRKRGGVTVITGGRRGPGWRVMDADPRQAGEIRDWIRSAVAGHGCPVDPDDAALAAGELFVNALMHGPSRGKVLAGCCLWREGARIVVCDGGSPGAPQLRETGAGTEAQSARLFLRLQISPKPCSCIN